MSAPDRLLIDYLRQRRELGETRVILSAPDAAALLRSLRGANPTRAAVADLPAAPPERRAPPLTPRERDAGAPAPGPTAPAIVQLGDLAQLRASALGCPRCRLAGTRRQVVFGEGNEQPNLVVVGEAPGNEEDRTGRPFVGQAGRMLNLLLASIGFPRESVYICNVLKCHPPGNRNPQSDEVEACSPWLRRQLELLAPRAILTVGTFPSQTLLGVGSPIGQLRGRAYRYGDVPLVPTYHPAALLRNPGWIRPVWEDLQLLRSLLDGEPARA